MDAQSTTVLARTSCTVFPLRSTKRTPVASPESGSTVTWRTTASFRRVSLPVRIAATIGKGIRPGLCFTIRHVVAGRSGQPAARSDRTFRSASVIGWGASYFPSGMLAIPAADP